MSAPLPPRPHPGRTEPGRTEPGRTGPGRSSVRTTPTRTAALWIPDWPVLAAMAVREIPAHVPAATHDGRRVVAVSATARAGSGTKFSIRPETAASYEPDGDGSAWASATSKRTRGSFTCSRAYPT